MFQRAPAYLRGREKASSLLVPFYTFEGLQAISLAPPPAPPTKRVISQGQVQFVPSIALPCQSPEPPLQVHL